MAADGPTRRVLVVDDDLNLLKNLGAFLESNGVTAVCVPDTAGALAAMDEGGIDTVIADYRLGRESGLELVKTIRYRAPECPIVLMSAYLDEWVQTIATGVGLLTCVRKPFSGTELLAAISVSPSAPVG